MKNERIIIDRRKHFTQQFFYELKWNMLVIEEVSCRNVCIITIALLTNTKHFFDEFWPLLDLYNFSIVHVKFLALEFFYIGKNSTPFVAIS